jgi:hypothetical protein
MEFGQSVSRKLETHTSPNAGRVLLALILVAGAGCVAPIARTSSIHKGLDFEFGAGPTVFRSAFSEDSTRLIPNEECLMVGGIGCVRASYGFDPSFGVDGTLGMSYGAAVPWVHDPIN